MLALHAILIIMIFIPILYPAAARFWLDSDYMSFAERLLHTDRAQIVLPHNYAFTPDKDIILSIARKYHLDLPLPLLAPEPKARRNSKYYRCRTAGHGHWTTGFFEIDRFCRNEEEIYVCIEGPEACFLRAAGELDFYELLEFGYRLCAGYVSDPTQEYGQTCRTPVASRTSIQEYLLSYNKARGSIKATRALTFILDGSGSPMETRLAMLSMLPFSMGGYSLSEPQLNVMVPLSRKGADLLGQNKCCCDLVWHEKKTIVEYDSNLTHLTAKQHEWDKKKATALQLSGYKVFSATAKDMASVQSQDRFFNGLRHALGLRSRQARMDEVWEKRQELLLFFHRRSLI